MLSSNVSCVGAYRCSIGIIEGCMLAGNREQSLEHMRSGLMVIMCKTSKHQSKRTEGSFAK